MVESSLARAFVTVFLAMLVASVYLLFPHGNTWVVLAALGILAYITIFYRLNYISPAIVYALPWLMIVFFSTIPISEYYRPLGKQTYALILTSLFAWLLAVSIGPVSTAPSSQASDDAPLMVSRRMFRWLFVFLLVVLAGECLASGFIPFVSLLTTGDSRYFDFGIHSVHGAILAYANAFGILSFYIFLRQGDRSFLWFYFFILCLFIALVSRQNVITLLMEGLAVWCLVRRPISRVAVAVCLAVLLTAFSIFGELRSGDILDIIKVTPEYAHLPKAAYWLYAYSYFNVLNLQNMMVNSGAPFFDGSMFSQLLPSFLRGDTQQFDYVVYSNMAVTSYMDPVFRDVGFKGVALSTFLFGLITGAALKNAVKHRSFVAIASYSCLYYCAIFSFFVNNWFYLPVIFQMVFFVIFDRLVLNGGFRQNRKHLAVAAS
ncbi:MAG TPA: O-antigen polymerase [Rhizomicrobium sp.]|nr:O-antigen polymerase [Rhizomicrobium sp.]